MSILNFISNYIVEIIICIIVAAVMIGNIGYNCTKNVITALIIEAEEVFKDAIKSGSFKMNYVIDNTYKQLPCLLKMVVSKEMIKDLAQNIFDNFENYALTNMESIKIPLSEYIFAKKKEKQEDEVEKLAEEIEKGE